MRENFDVVVIGGGTTGTGVIRDLVPVSYTHLDVYKRQAPYRAAFQTDSAQTHKIEITAFGSRVNTFGAIHDCDEPEIYFDPNAWRTTLDSWAYEYQLKKTGILKAPVLWKQK